MMCPDFFADAACGISQMAAMALRAPEWNASDDDGGRMGLAFSPKV